MTPADIVDSVAGFVRTSMGSVSLRDRYAAMGMTTESTNSAGEFTRKIREEVDWVAAFVKEIDFRLA